MARISGVDIPRDKRVVISLTYIFGIGNTTEPLPQYIAKALSDYSLGLATPEGYSGYGDEQGLTELREKIAKVFYPGLVTDDEVSASHAIEYLKDNKLGRATFFPISIIKGRCVDEDTLSIFNLLNVIISDFSSIFTSRNDLQF